MDIGLFGGTFDPPHIGHINLARRFYAKSRSDLLIVMPANIPPHKASSTTPAAMRLEMTRLACLSLGEEGINYTVSDYEINRSDKSYTYLTVKYLREKYRPEVINLCVGSDMLFSFDTWKCAEEILVSCRIFSLAREEGEYDEMCRKAKYFNDNYGADVHIMKGSPVVASSTDIRNGGEMEKLTEKRVYEYIKSHGLYE